MSNIWRSCWPLVVGMIIVIHQTKARSSHSRKSIWRMTGLMARCAESVWLKHFRDRGLDSVSTSQLKFCSTRPWSLEEIQFNPRKNGKALIWDTDTLHLGKETHSSWRIHPKMSISYITEWAGTEKWFKYDRKMNIVYFIIQTHVKGWTWLTLMLLI